MAFVNENNGELPDRSPADSGERSQYYNSTYINMSKINELPLCFTRTTISSARGDKKKIQQSTQFRNGILTRIILSIIKQTVKVCFMYVCQSDILGVIKLRWRS